MDNATAETYDHPEGCWEQEDDCRRPRATSLSNDRHLVDPVSWVIWWWLKPPQQFLTLSKLPGSLFPRAFRMREWNGSISPGNANVEGKRMCCVSTFQIAAAPCEDREGLIISMSLAIFHVTCPDSYLTSHLPRAPLQSCRPPRLPTASSGSVPLL